MSTDEYVDEEFEPTFESTEPQMQRKGPGKGSDTAASSSLANPLVASGKPRPTFFSFPFLFFVASIVRMHACMRPIIDIHTF